jgi:flavin reductase (DIM6/NTAB) family NADH-FMN oxidoreductase RutF
MSFAPLPVSRGATRRHAGVVEPLLVDAVAAAGRVDFLDAMAAAVTGVNVVTTDGTAGRLGLTVSAMTSVSADPPLLLIGLRSCSPLAPALLANGVFGVSVLGADQAAVADTFAGRRYHGKPYDFGATGWDTGASGVPLLRDAASRFECRVSGHLEAGTHTLVLGAVTAADESGRPALAYTRRRFAALRPLPDG